MSSQNPYSRKRAMAWVSALVMAVSGSVHSQAQAPKISSTAMPEGGFRLVVVTRSTDVELAQALLKPAAQRACGDLVVVWGKHQFKASEPIAGQADANQPEMTFTQEIRCRTSSEPPILVPRTPATGPTDAAKRQVELLNANFFAAKDGDNAIGAYLMLGEGMQTMTTLEDWKTKVSALNVRAGADIRRVWRRWTWRVDPAGALPGLYAAVDFVGESQNFAYLCGYAVWFRQGSGRFMLMRLEENTLERSSIAKLTAEQLESVKREFRCDR